MTATTLMPVLPAAVRDALLRLAADVRAVDGGWQVGAHACDAALDPLADALYAGWYAAPGPPSTRADDPPVRRASLVPALRAAHAGSGLTEQPWVVVQAGPTGIVVATSGSRTRTLRPGEYVVPGRLGAPAAPGELVHAVGRSDLLDAERGLWWTFSADEPEPPIGRVYLDVRPATAARALAEVTAALTAAGTAYQLKCPADPDVCARVDAMVLYHPEPARDAVLSGLLERWAALGPLLDPAVPPLTCAVRPGLSWADDDGGGVRSFGETRCRALAAGLLASGGAWPDGTADDRLGVLLDALRRADIDPAQPWRAAAT